MMRIEDVLISQNIDKLCHVSSVYATELKEMATNKNYDINRLVFFVEISNPKKREQ